MDTLSLSKAIINSPLCAAVPGASIHIMGTHDHATRRDVATLAFILPQRPVSVRLTMDGLFGAPWQMRDLGRVANRNRH